MSSRDGHASPILCQGEGPQDPIQVRSPQQADRPSKKGRMNSYAQAAGADITRAFRPLEASSEVEYEPSAAPDLLHPVSDEGQAPDFAVFDNPHKKATAGRQPFFLELFCGTAGMCRAFLNSGGSALGIDHGWTISGSRLLPSVLTSAIRTILSWLSPRCAEPILCGLVRLAARPPVHDPSPSLLS